MKKSDLVSNGDIKRYVFLKGETIRLYSEMQKVTENTSKQEVERLQAEYYKVQQEKDEIGQRISMMQSKISRKIQRLYTKPDGTDVKAFDDDAAEFFDALSDYYESCKIRLTGMLHELEQYPSEKLSIKQRFQRWKLKRMINREIDGYTQKQKECVYPY